MNEADVRRIVAETVAETLLRLGIETDDPLETQADFLHLRKWRKSVETAGRQTFLTAVGIITTGILGLIWLALRGGGNG